MNIYEVAHFSSQKPVPEKTQSVFKRYDFIKIHALESHVTN